MATKYWLKLRRTTSSLLRLTLPCSTQSEAQSDPDIDQTKKTETQQE